jgi:hypothetical protein
MNEESDRRTTPHKAAQTAPGPRDTLSRQGAMNLALRLERYWHERGYPAVRFWAEPVEERFTKVGTYEIYRVVCNLINGLPPVYRNGPP